MSKHSHKFVEEYNGLIGLGYNRETDINTLLYYLQKFSEDRHARLIIPRMSDEDIEELFNSLGKYMKKYLKEEEYHREFLKDDN